MSIKVGETLRKRKYKKHSRGIRRITQKEVEESFDLGKRPRSGRDTAQEKTQKAFPLPPKSRREGIPQIVAEGSR